MPTLIALDKSASAGVGVEGRGSPNSPKGTRTDQSTVRGRDGGTGVCSKQETSPRTRQGPMKASHTVLTDSVTEKGDRSDNTYSVDTQEGSANGMAGRVKTRHRNISPARAKLVSVDMASGNIMDLSSAKTMLPTPPSSAKSQRPTSAQRFRKMVFDCRDT